MNQPVILFDGVCNLCNGFVQFIIKNDPKGKFKFASLQSSFAKQELEKRNIDPEILESVILINGDQMYSRSTAALRIAKMLGSFWQLTYLFIIIPTFIRDGIYNFIGKNRYKWFGKKDQCMVPTPNLKSRFLD